MIKINKRHKASLVRKYVDYAIEEILLPNLKALAGNAPANVSKRLLTFFDEGYLRALLVIEPSDIEGVIKQVSDVFPELAEYYCPALILSEINLPYHEIPSSVAEEVDKETVERLATLAAVKLTAIKAGRSLQYIDTLIACLTSGASHYKKRKMLIRLQLASAGGYNISSKERKAFPAWIKNFGSCFDFEKVAGEFGEDICNRLDLSVCPYCAIENLSILKADLSRPELDHFYPRSRFPYLAISLNNLIPAGSSCNQKSKKNHPMLSHAHPFVQGMGDEDLFVFNYLSNGNKITDLKISLKAQSIKCNNMNIERFRLAEKYKYYEELTCWFSNAYAMKSLLRQLGHRVSSAEVKGLPYFESELKRATNKVTAQQFKVEAVNKIFGTAFKVVQQKP